MLAWWYFSIIVGASNLQSTLQVRPPAGCSLSGKVSGQVAHLTKKYNLVLAKGGDALRLGGNHWPGAEQRQPNRQSIVMR